MFRPVGGLGNQLFQLGVAMNIASRLGVGVSADCTNWNTSGVREFELKSFESGLEVITRSSIRTFASQLIVRLPDPRRREVRYSSPGFFGVIRETPGLTFEEPILAVPKPPYLHGYFQSWRYLMGVESELNQALRQIVNPSNWYQETRAMLLGLGKFVAVQIRLGDYLGNPKYGHLRVSYFLNALENLLSEVGSLPIVVFSDEVEKARNMLPPTFGGEKANIKYLSPPVNSRPIESLNLLAIGEYKIISNSSFGWWAAWLGDNSRRKVIAPVPWVAGSRIDGDSLYLPHWIRRSN
jgi:hypothetical protein